MLVQIGYDENQLQPIIINEVRMILNFNAGTAVGMSPFLAKGLSQYKNPNHNYISGYQNNFNYFYRFWSQPRLGQVHYDEEDAHRCSPGKYPDHHWASI